MVTSCPASPAESLLSSVEGELVFQVRGSCRDGQIIRLRSPKCTIGSARHCTLRLRARGVRPIHCLVVRGARRILVRRWAPDTRVNGRPFVDAALAPGDCLSIGPIDLVALDPTGSLDSSPPGTGSIASKDAARAPGAEKEAPSAGATVTGRRPLLPEDDRLAEANRIHRNRSRRLLKRLREARQMIAQLLEEPRHPDKAVRGDVGIKQQAAEIAAQAETLNKRETALAAKREELEEARQRMAVQLDEAQSDIEQRRRGLDARQDRIDAQQVLFDREREQWERSKGDEQAALETLRSELEALREELEAREKALDLRRESLDVRQVELKARQYRTQAHPSDQEPRNTEVIYPDEPPRPAVEAPPEREQAVSEPAVEAPPEGERAEAGPEVDSLAEAEPAEAPAPEETSRCEQELSGERDDPGRPKLSAEQHQPCREEDEEKADACEDASAGEGPRRPQPTAGPKTADSPEATGRITLGGISPTDDDDEASIDEYMAQLVARVRGATDGPPARRPVAPPPPQEPAPREDSPPPQDPEPREGPAPPQESQPPEDPPPPQEPDPREDAVPPQESEAREDPPSPQERDSHENPAPPQESQPREDPPPPQEPEAREDPAALQEPEAREDPPPPQEPDPREDPAAPQEAEPREDPPAPQKAEVREPPPPPASTPERPYDLSALRELANLSDRSAVDEHARSRLVRLLIGKAVVALAGLVAGAVLIALWYTRPGLPTPYYAGAAGLIVALIWGIQYAILKGKVGVTESGHLHWKGGRRQPDPRSDQSG